MKVYKTKVWKFGEEIVPLIRTVQSNQKKFLSASLIHPLRIISAIAAHSVTSTTLKTPKPKRKISIITIKVVLDLTTNHLDPILP